MPTNANTFNSRVTSEALEAKYREVFPAQGGAELVQDLFASGVIQPVVDFSTVAEGSVLPQNLQTAWDFSTGFNSISGLTTTTIINNTGFWKVDWWYLVRADETINLNLNIYDGTTAKTIWEAETGPGTTNIGEFNDEISQIVFLRAGDSLRASPTLNTAYRWNIWYRQIADVNGNLVNPLGFTFS